MLEGDTVNTWDCDTVNTWEGDIINTWEGDIVNTWDRLHYQHMHGDTART